MNGPGTSRYNVREVMSSIMVVAVFLGAMLRGGDATDLLLFFLLAALPPFVLLRLDRPSALPVTTLLIVASAFLAWGAALEFRPIPQPWSSPIRHVPWSMIDLRRSFGYLSAFYAVACVGWWKAQPHPTIRLRDIGGMLAIASPWVFLPWMLWLRSEESIEIGKVRIWAIVFLFGLLAGLLSRRRHRLIATLLFLLWVSALSQLAITPALPTPGPMPPKWSLVPKIGKSRPPRRPLPRDLPGNTDDDAPLSEISDEDPR